MRDERKVLFRKQFVDIAVVGVRRQDTKDMRTKGIGSWRRRVGGGSTARKKNADVGTSSGTVMRGANLVPVCSGTGLRCRMQECRCRRHQP